MYCALRDSKEMKISYDWRGGPGCSKGCSIFQTESKQFETLIKRMQDEDGINGYDNDIIVETEEFEPSVSPDDYK